MTTTVTSSEAPTRSPTFAGLLTTAREIWDEHHLLDDLRSSVEGDLQRINDAVDSKGLLTRPEVVRQASTIVQLAAREAAYERGGQRDPSDVARIGNTLLAVLATTQPADYNPCEIRISTNLTSGLISPGKRSARAEEILLMRLWTISYALRGRAAMRAAVQYALVEGGAWPSETTEVQPSDFDTPRAPTSVRLPGSRWSGERTVPLPMWCRPMIADLIDNHLAHNQRAINHPLVYSDGGGESGYRASATATTHLVRTMKNAGLGSQHLKPTGILKWRIATTARTEGLFAAQTHLGKKYLRHLLAYLNDEDITPHKAPSVPDFLAM